VMAIGPDAARPGTANNQNQARAAKADSLIYFLVAA